MIQQVINAAQFADAHFQNNPAPTQFGPSIEQRVGALEGGQSQHTEIAAHGPTTDAAKPISTEAPVVQRLTPNFQALHDRLNRPI